MKKYASAFLALLLLGCAGCGWLSGEAGVPEPFQVHDSTAAPAPDPVPDSVPVPDPVPVPDSVSVPEPAAIPTPVPAAGQDRPTDLEPDETQAEIYSRQADVYLDMEDREKALEVLERGYEATGSAKLLDRLHELGHVSGDEPVEWGDPVFERLVREKLGIAEGPVYARDLDGITGLQIYGDTHIFFNYEFGDTNPSFRHVSAGGEVIALYEVSGTTYMERGQLRNVDALIYFRDLNSVMVIADHVEDVSVLRNLSLTYAVFWANDVSDISILNEINAESENPHTNVLNSEQFIELGARVRVGD